MTKQPLPKSQGQGKLASSELPLDLPGWRFILLADVADHSQAFFLFRPDRVNPFSVMPNEHGFAHLANLGLFGYEHPHPLLPPVLAGWQRIGLSRGLVRKVFPGTTLAVEANLWVLGFEWATKEGTAWQAFTKAQTLLHPKNLALVPPMLLPLYYLTRMMEWPLERGQDRHFAAQWLPFLVESQEQLLPVLNDLYRFWMDGRSEAASRYRKRHHVSGGLVERGAEAEGTGAFLGYLGVEEAKDLAESERLEPRLLTLLEEASHKLWEEGRTDRHLPTGLPLEGLLPLALLSHEALAHYGVDLNEVDTPAKLAQFWASPATRS
jgi:hypothetical protein